MIKKVFFVVFVAISSHYLQSQNFFKRNLHQDFLKIKNEILIKSSQGDLVKIERFGGVADGKTDNSTAFTTAIEFLSKRGGGILEISEGVWITGPIVLKSNVRIHTLKGSRIVFSTKRENYPLIDGNYEGKPNKRCQSDISAENAENIAITGEGVFDGSGQIWRPVKKIKVNENFWNELLASGGVLNDAKNIWYPSVTSLAGSLRTEMDSTPKNENEWLRIKDFLRPTMISLISCKNVLFSGVSLTNSPAWTFHPLLCENVIVEKLNIVNPKYGQNTDAIDVESCRDVFITGCNISVGDDGICVKSGKDEFGRLRGIPSENIFVDSCLVKEAHGGFVVGSEMSGGVRNVRVTNCTFSGTDSGLRFKSTRGRGGVVENIQVNNIYMENINGDAIIFDLYYGLKDPANIIRKSDITTPSFRNIIVSDIVCKGSKRAIFLNGLPEMNLKNIALKNSIFTSDIGGIVKYTDKIMLKNIQLNTSDKSDLVISDSKHININKTFFPELNKSTIVVSGNSDSVKIDQSPIISTEKYRIFRDL